MALCHLCHMLAGMNPIPLSQWADANGIPRRTAYNWAKSGKLNVPLHRTLTGRLMVLDDDDDTDAQRAHPFAAAYAEALELPVADRTADMDHSTVLEAWGTSLYDAVAPDLRPAVLQLAVAAASRRPKRDVPARFADWIGRVELADWYEATGLPEAAAMVRSHGPITDEDSFWACWPTGVDSFEWRNELDELVSRCLSEAGGGAPSGHSAVEYLAENGTTGVQAVKIAGRREGLRITIGALSARQQPRFPLPDKGDLWDLHVLYVDPMYALARPACRAAARVICEVAGWDPQSPAPPQGHPLHEIGFTACSHAARVALAPYEHAAHLREISALRRIALGQPVADQQTSGRDRPTGL
jgi:hypothetical protein